MTTVAAGTTPQAAAYAWLGVAGRLLSGLNHALSNRLSVLRSTDLLTDPAPGGFSAADLVARETRELEHLLRMYRLLAFVDRPAEGGSLVVDAAPEAFKLLAHMADTEHVECVLHADPLAPPVLLDAISLVQVVTLLLRSVAVCVAPAGMEPRRITLSVARVADRTRIAAHAPDAVAHDPAAPCGELDAVRWLVRDVEGALEFGAAEGGGVRAVLELASLARTRAMERSA